MHQRSKSVASGRPSGTDGSDFSYRMVVESRYQKVANEKSRLSALIIVQAVIQMIGVTFTYLLTSGGEGPDMVAISSGAVGLISLLLGELGWISPIFFLDLSFGVPIILLADFPIKHFLHCIKGRRRSRVNLLRAYMVGSTVATFLSIACVFKSNLSFEVIQNPSNWGTMKFELLEAICVIIGFLVQICIINNVRSLVRNMSPPKRAS